MWVSTENLSQERSGIEGFEIVERDLNALFQREVPKAEESTVSIANSNKNTEQEKAWNTTTKPCPGPKLTKPVTQQQLEFATAIMEDFTQRLSGRNPTLAVMNKLNGVEQQQEEEDVSLSLDDCTDELIKQATSTENLCQMYEGWMPWI